MRSAAVLILSLSIFCPSWAASIHNLASIGPGGGGGVFAAVFHNSDPNVILLGQDIGGVVKSSDGGLHWRHVNARGFARPEIGLDLFFVDELVAHPTRDSEFFACTQSGLFRSEDSGESWSVVIPSPTSSDAELPVSWISFSPNNSSLALAGGGSWHEPDVEEDLVLYRSLDGGQTFNFIDLEGMPELATITSIAFDPGDGSVFISTTAGLFRSTNNGDSFNKVGFSFRHDQGQWIGIEGSGAQKTYWYVLYTLGEDGEPGTRSAGIYRSSNGVSWTEISGHPTINDPESNELIRPLGGRLQPGTPSSLFLNLRTDGGEGGLYQYDGSWSNLTEDLVDTTWSAGSGFFGVAPECLTFYRGDPQLMISCNEKAVFKTEDAGVSWTQISTIGLGEGRWSGTGAEVVSTYDVAVSEDAVYAAFEDIGFWRSDDRGASWKQLLWPGATPDTVRPDGATEIFVHPVDGKRLYVALGSFSNDLREPSVRSEIHRSSDGGMTTTNVTPATSAQLLGRPALAVVWGDTPSEDTLYCAFHGEGLYKSTDGGSTWSELGADIPSPDRELVFRITVDPDSPTTVYLGLWTDFDAFPSAGGIYRSDNGGSTWSRLENYPYQDVALIRFAGNPRRLFVGGWTQDKGSLLVLDGSNFSTVQPFVTAITETPSSPTVLYTAASATFVRGTGQNAGIYRSSDNGASWLRLSGNLHHSGIFDLEILPDQPQLLLAASDGDGILVAELDDHRRSFSQFSDGGGISSSVLLINPSPSRSANAGLKLFDSLGNPLPVELDGETQQGELLFNLPPQDLAFYSSSGGENVRTGSVLLEADSRIEGTILFSGDTTGVAGVGAVKASNLKFLIPIESDLEAGIRTGIALSNHHPDEQDLTVCLRRADGSSPDGGETIITLPPRGQLARFVEEIYADSSIDFGSFQGTLTVESKAPVAGMAIRVSPAQFATLPVTPVGFGSKRLHFPQFGDGAGITSTLILINPSGDSPTTGTVHLFDALGEPLAASMNGVERMGQFEFALPPYGVEFFSSEGLREQVATGSVHVESNGFIGGTILFAGDFGVAGVGTASLSTRFMVPVDSDGTAGISTGVALANPAPGPTMATLRLRRTGSMDPDPIALIPLAGKGQLARFPAEIFAADEIDLAQFKGTLEVQAPHPLAGMAIRVSRQEFATLPVSRVD